MIGFQLVFLAGLVGAAFAGHAFSSQHIHRYDGHHELVHHGHGHDHHDYYVRKYCFLLFVIVYVSMVTVSSQISPDQYNSIKICIMHLVK